MVLENDIQVSQTKSDQKQSGHEIEEDNEVVETNEVVVVRPENLKSIDSKGLEILNQSKSIITYDTDFNELVALIVEKQATNKSKYQNLAAKTVFLVEESEFDVILNIMNDKN